MQVFQKCIARSFAVVIMMIIPTEKLSKNADSAMGTSVTISAAELKIYLKEESLVNKRLVAL